jgi:hypothetical protein
MYSYLDYPLLLALNVVRSADEEWHMRDLPDDGHDFAGDSPYPGESQPRREYLPEISHDRVGLDEAFESIPRLAGWSETGQGGWPIYGAPIADEVPTPHGPSGVPPPGRLPGAGRGSARRVGRRPARMMALCAAVVVPALAAGTGIALVSTTGGGTANVALAGSSSDAISPVSASASPSASTSSPDRTRPPAKASANMGLEIGTGESGPGTLAGILAAADNSVEGRGLLPPAKCDDYRQNANGAIVCTSPVPGVAEVYYQNYSSLTALYSAYKAQVTGLDGGTFRQNTHTCGNSAVSYAEFGWNQEEGHPHNFTVAQMAAGQVGQLFASGRMACFATRTPHGVSQDIVWTIDGGPALGVAIGNGTPSAVYQLWASLHHAVLFRGTEMCGTAPKMNLHDIPTGNLKVIPVCPPGVQAVPAAPSA